MLDTEKGDYLLVEVGGRYEDERGNKKKGLHGSVGVGVYKCSIGGLCMSEKGQCAIRQPLCQGIAHYLLPNQGYFCVCETEVKRMIVSMCNPCRLLSGDRVVKQKLDQTKACKDRRQ